MRRPAAPVPHSSSDVLLPLGFALSPARVLTFSESPEIVLLRSEVQTSGALLMLCRGDARVRALIMRGQPSAKRNAFFLLLTPGFRTPLHPGVFVCRASGTNFVESRLLSVPISCPAFGSNCLASRHRLLECPP